MAEKKTTEDAPAETVEAPEVNVPVAPIPHGYDQDSGAFYA